MTKYDIKQMMVKTELNCDDCPKCKNAEHSQREELDFDCDGGIEEWVCEKCRTEWNVYYVVKIIGKEVTN